MSAAGGPSRPIPNSYWVREGRFAAGALLGRDRPHRDGGRLLAGAGRAHRPGGPRPDRRVVAARGEELAPHRVAPDPPPAGLRTAVGRARPPLAGVAGPGRRRWAG